jgi:predicted TIM-barrel fold metal-dependent hydrolase
MAPALNFPVFDADNHMYETQDALTKFLPKEHRDAIAIVEVNRRKKLLVNGRISNMIPNPTFERVAAPGSAEAYFQGNNPDMLSFREFIGEPITSPPAFREPGARLELMNELGLDYATMYPTLASLIEARSTDNPKLAHVMIHALNEWMHEHWSFDYEGRIFSTPVITLPIVDEAIKEFHWCLERGMKTFLMRPAPVPGLNGRTRSMALPEFDPFWAEVEKAGVTVTIHASDTGYIKYVDDWEPMDEWDAFKASPLRNLVMGHRDICDTISAMICHGLFDRFPNLKVAVIENGSSWVPGLVHDLHRSYGINSGLYAQDPVEVFKKHFWIHPFFEEDPQELIDLMTPEHVLFGSDYPHPEGMAEPLSFAKYLEPLMPESDVAKIMGGNISGLLGVELEHKIA